MYESEYYIYDIIKNNPVLTKKDLDKLILEYKKTGDNLIHDKIILSNAGLVLRIAQKFSFGCPSIDIADLFHEGIKGLIEALGRFELSYQTAFSTYATPWIKKYIREFANSSEMIIRPFRIAEARKKIEQLCREYYLLYNRKPTMEEIKKSTGYKGVLLEYVLTDWNQQCLSLDKEAITEQEENITLGNLIPSDRNIENYVCNKDMKKRVSILLRKILSKNELFVIEQLYGLNGKEVLSGREIGEKWDLPIRGYIRLKI